jgi:hypothetical protein
MEKLIFALVASNAYRPQEPVVAEPEEFQPFDLQALRIMDQLPQYRGAFHNAQSAQRTSFTKEWSLSKSS